MVDWFIPGYKAGGPIQSCLNVAKALKDYYDVYVLTSDRDHGDTEPYRNIITNVWNTEILAEAKVYYIKTTNLNPTSLTEIINEISPHFIYLNHLFSPKYVILPLWLKWRNKISAEIILCPRGGLHKSAISEKFYKKILFISLLKVMRISDLIRFHATNEKEKKEIINYFPGSNILICNNLPSQEQEELKIIPKVKGELNCIFISRIVSIKNLLFFLNILEGIDVKLNLTIAGPIEDKNYWDICQEKITTLPSFIKVVYIGSIGREEIKNSLQKNHLFILPSTGENFGHSIFESFLFGRPVLISDCTPWKPTIKNKTGWAISLENPSGFQNAIETASQWDQKEFNEFAQSSWDFAHQFINNPDLINQYKKLFA